MGILSLTFRDLQYIEALAEYKHFGKAAKSCFVSQPALSAQIKKIEGYFGKTFFERRNKQVFLTHDGVEIVGKAHELLERAKILEDTFKNNQNIISKTLNIGIIHTLSPYYPSYFLRDLLLKYPNCSVELKEGYTEELIVDLKSGKIDLMIASEIFHDEKLEIHQIFKEPLYIIVNNHHPFASRQNIKLSDLNAEEMIFLKEGNCLRNESIDLCPKNKRGNIKEYYLNNLETLKFMIALNPKYAIIPKMSLKLDDSIKNFVSIKPIDDPKAFRQISLYFRKNGTRAKDAHEFLKCLVENI